MEQVSYGPVIMSIMLIMSYYIGFFNVRISQHGTSVLRLIRRSNSRDLTLREFTRPDFTRIYATWLYANLRDLTLREFTRPDYANLCDLTLRDLTCYIGFFIIYLKKQDDSIP